jgi:CubicO group peptidase (beta-lactamase class C family)
LPAPERFRRLVREAQAQGRLPSLSAAVFRSGEIVWDEAIGLADVEQRFEATTDSQYAVASITKTFTAASVMQLRDAGKLDLEDPLSRHLPEAAHGTPTLRRLLSHASGLQREPPGNVWETLKFPDEQELLATLADAEQVLPPSTAWHYSNLAYALLGHVVSHVSGTPYHEYVREQLLEPVGLDRTTWGPGERAALPYFVEPYSDAVRREPVLELGGKGGESGLYSTVGDLARWGSFLADPDESVLAPASVAEMHNLQIMAEPDWTLGWGLGIELWRRGERVYGGHTGGFPGFLSIVLYSRRDKIGAVLLTNSGTWPKLSPTGLRGSRGVGTRGRTTRGDRFAARPLVVGGRRDDLQLAEGQAGGAVRGGPAGTRALPLRAGGRGPLPRRLGPRARRGATRRPRRGWRRRPALLGDVSVHARTRDLRHRALGGIGGTSRPGGTAVVSSSPP